MKQDEIIEMWNSITKYAPSEVRITEFANLVAAKEREACAKVCSELGEWACVHDIEARGEQA